jgi:hypothetical protein
LLAYSPEINYDFFSLLITATKENKFMAIFLSSEAVIWLQAQRS